MILEIDCGNSLIKWRIFDATVSHIVAHGAAADDVELINQLVDAAFHTISRVRLVSVRADDETDRLVKRLKALFSIDPDIARSQRNLAGVNNGYADYRSLGADRWLAIVSAFNLKGTACLVLDIGTAVTADYITATGQHLGGYICPGVTLMRKQLSEHTGRIGYAPSLGSECRRPARSTTVAVECGCILMLEGFIQNQLRIAGDYLGEAFCTILTGGDASLVEGCVPNALVIPDLVFRGLAIACPD